MVVDYWDGIVVGGGTTCSEWCCGRVLSVKYFSLYVNHPMDSSYIMLIISVCISFIKKKKKSTKNLNHCNLENMGDMCQVLFGITAHV